MLRDILKPARLPKHTGIVTKHAKNDIMVARSEMSRRLEEFAAYQATDSENETPGW